MSIDFSSQSIKDHMMEVEIGLEKESLRVTPQGNLSHTSHPFPGDSHIERDFCENQTELITGVAYSVDEALDQLAQLHEKVVKKLYHLESGKELLWAFSNPPYVKGEDDIPIATYEGELKQKEIYRKYLAGKYGKKKMLFSGIHFNFSFSQAFLENGYKQSAFSDYQTYKDGIYLELAKKVTKYSWFIVYLTAASSVLDGSFSDEKEKDVDILSDYSSVRCSKDGYWNPFIPVIQYDSLGDYVHSIDHYVKIGKLREPSELYYPVRLKPKGSNLLHHLLETGVNHIELRMLDLNPFSPVGILKEDLEFLHLFILYLMSLKDEDFKEADQIRAVENMKRAAAYEEESLWIENDTGEKVAVREEADKILLDMEKFFENLGIKDEHIGDVLKYQKRKIQNPEERYAVKVRNQFGTGYVKKGIALAEEYAGSIENE